MKRAFYFLFICFVVLVWLCTASILIGRQHTEVSLIPEIQRCGNRLCYLGIIPGTTTQAEATSIILGTSRLITSVNLTDLYMRQAEPGYMVGFIPPIPTAEPDKSSVLMKEIHISPFSSTYIPVGNVVMRLGSPCFVGSGRGTVNLYYADAVFIISVDVRDNWLTPASRLDHIVFRKDEIDICPNEALPEGKIPVYNWRGFRSYPPTP